MPEIQVLVIGGGFYGARLALHFAERGRKVALVEKEKDILLKASFNNQARVHNGYHYPRSFLTALRSHLNYARFIEEYEDCVTHQFPCYYGIAKNGSNVTASQFRAFCGRIGAPLGKAPDKIKKMVNPVLVEEVFAVEECVFDANKLREHLRARMEDAGVRIYCDTYAEKVMLKTKDSLSVQLLQNDMPFTIEAGEVYNCIYSATNGILKGSHLEPVELKHEWTEMALVEAPPALKDVGFTLMCGSFFSFMPFPSENLHSLSHVRYTPHASWLEGKVRTPPPLFARHSHAAIMMKDAARYLPAMAQCRYQKSLWEVKTVLPLSERDDSRPILYLKDAGLPRLTCVMGGKIDNIYDIFSELEARPA
jgi:glycine/D-amino acid oxidase-like deaminating enzyme